ncbi:PAS domain S-box protein [Sporosarcina sp. NPDC096371]|uniref:PAS domain S-box protein n=1 Tax=Sporosarcina sp. NPDC096371 TaxID=3364530 RepID=UPI00380CD4D4
MNTDTDVDDWISTGNVETIIFSLTRDGVILNANKEFCQMLGREIHSITGASMLEVVHVEDRTLFMQRITESYEGNIIPFTFRSTRRKGNSLPFYVNMCRWISQDEVCIHAIPIVDPSNYTAIEQSLVEKKITVFDITDSAAINCDFNGIVVAVNSDYDKLFGWKHKELKGNKSPFVPEFLLHKMIEIKERLLAGAKVIRMNTARMTRNGIMIPVNLTILPDYDSGGTVQGVFALSRKLEETLEMKAFIEQEMSNIVQQEMLIKDITNNLEVGICQYDVEQEKFLYINPGMGRLLGVPIFDLLQDKMLLVSTCHPDDEHELIRFYDELSKEFTEIEYRVLNIDGGFSWVRTKITPVMDEAGNVVRYVSISHDISKQKMQDELLRKWDKLNIVGQLSASLAHEIRNPLTTVKGFIQLFAMGPENTFGPIMIEELDKIESTIEDFLQLAKPSIGTAFTAASIHEQLIRTVSLMEKEAWLHNIKLNLKLHDQDQFINCESGQIQQVFINLLKNSIESMPDGGEIEVSTMVEENQMVKITVVDTGIGIPPERLSKLGEPFYSHKEKGIGLGLMVSYKIIENHNGSIRFKSTEGYGTTVEVRLPISGGD